MIHEQNNLRFINAKAGGVRGDKGEEAWYVNVERVSDGHFVDQQGWFVREFTAEELSMFITEWEKEHPGAGVEPTPTHCLACDQVLTSDRDTQFQFDNVLWIGFFGGYGLFTDNLDAQLPSNTEDRWLRDDSGEYQITTDDDGQQHPVDNPDWEPEYREERILPGRPDYEAVICHDCAHSLCETIPWIGKLIQPESSHAHRSKFWDSHPEHIGWDNPANKENKNK